MPSEKVLRRLCQSIIAREKETHGSGMVLALLVDAFFVVAFLGFEAAIS